MDLFLFVCLRNCDMYKPHHMMIMLLCIPEGWLLCQCGGGNRVVMCHDYDSLVWCTDNGWRYNCAQLNRSVIPMSRSKVDGRRWRSMIAVYFYRRRRWCWWCGHSERGIVAALMAFSFVLSSSSELMMGSTLDGLSDVLSYRRYQNDRCDPTCTKIWMSQRLTSMTLDRWSC